MMAILRYAPGLRATARQGAALLHTVHASTLSYALRRASTLAMVRSMVERLSGTARFGADALVALDGMAITFYDSLRHGCAPFGPGVAGGGVIWAMQVSGRLRTHAAQMPATLAGQGRFQHVAFRGVGDEAPACVERKGKRPVAADEDHGLGMGRPGQHGSQAAHTARHVAQQGSHVDPAGLRMPAGEPH